MLNAAISELRCCPVCKLQPPRMSIISCNRCKVNYHWACGRNLVTCKGCAAKMYVIRTGAPLNMGDDPSVEKIYKIRKMMLVADKRSIIEMGANIEDIIDAGCDITELNQLGFTWEDLMGMGLKIQHLGRKDIFPPIQMVESYKANWQWIKNMFPRCNVSDIQEIAYTDEELKLLGFTKRVIKDHFLYQTTTQLQPNSRKIPSPLSFR